MKKKYRSLWGKFVVSKVDRIKKNYSKTSDKNRRTLSDYWPLFTIENRSSYPFEKDIFVH